MSAILSALDTLPPERNDPALPPSSKPFNYQGWDRVLGRFLKNAGLSQTLRGFENDMLVINPDVEKEDIPPALQQLQLDLTKLSQNESLPEEPIEERRLEYVRLTNGAMPVSQTQLTRSISTLLAQNRAKNNASNKNEFLRKRRRMDPSPSGTEQEGSSTSAEELPTCARTDAAPVNRDVQMKYDVAKNEGGPLRRTVKSEQPKTDIQSQQPHRHPGIPDDPEDSPTLRRHPGLRERFSNLEGHLAVRYVPSPPASLLDRIRFLEDHIIRLERDYPPWAALHFNQPNRGWPPPPRATPVIVPSHLTSTDDQPGDDLATFQDPSRTDPTTPASPWPVDPSQQPGGARGGPSRPRAKAKASSLHRAVMQKLEVQKALAGND